MGFGFSINQTLCTSCLQLPPAQPWVEICVHDSLIFRQDGSAVQWKRQCFLGLVISPFYLCFLSSLTTFYEQIPLCCYYTWFMTICHICTSRPWNVRLKVKVKSDGTIITDHWKRTHEYICCIFDYIRCFIELTKNNLGRWKICVSLVCSVRPLNVARWWPHNVDLNAPFEQHGHAGASRQHVRCQWALMQFTGWFQRCGKPAFQNISQALPTRGRTCSDRLRWVGIRQITQLE